MLHQSNKQATAVVSRDGFKDSMFKAKAKGLRGQKTKIKNNLNFKFKSAYLQCDND